MFGKAVRKSYFDVKAAENHFKVGPGNYRIQSEFGMYNPNDIKGWTQSKIFENGRDSNSKINLKLNMRIDDLKK